MSTAAVAADALGRHRSPEATPPRRRTATAHLRAVPAAPTESPVAPAPTVAPRRRPRIEGATTDRLPVRGCSGEELGRRASVQPEPATLRLTDRGTVVASPGSEVLQRTDDPRLGDSFAPPGTPTGAAVVRAAEDGVGYFVVWRVVDGELDVITTPPRDVVGATFEELLSHARGQYADGEGLR